MKYESTTTTKPLLKHIRLISTKAKSVSTKVTRILKNAKLQQVALESKAKVNATAAIKAKAEQASKALKLPTDHI